MDLPTFRYHPDPLASGAFVRKAGTCVCCEKAVDFLYGGPAYSTHDLDGKLCPWCIADGSAHAKYAASFAESYPLLKAGVPASVIEEVTRRTPGYTSWQGEEWLAHCGDACAFIGDATRDVLRSMTPEEMAPLIDVFGLDEAWFRELAEEYEPGFDPALYHFQCLCCGVRRFGMDWS